MRVSLVIGALALGLAPTTVRADEPPVAAYIATGTVLATVALDSLTAEASYLTLDNANGYGHGRFALHPTLPLVYLSALGGVDVFDLSTRRKAGAVSLPTGSTVGAARLALSSDGSRLFVLYEDVLFMIDTSDMRIADSAGFFARAVDMVLSHDGVNAWVVDEIGSLYQFTVDEVLEFDFDVAVPRDAVALAISADDSRLLVALRERRAVDIFDRSTRYLGSIVLGGIPSGIAFAPSGHDAYVGVQSSEFVGVDQIDTGAMMIQDQFPLPFVVGDIAVAPDGRLFLPPAYSNSSCGVAVLDPSQGQITGTIALPNAIDVHFGAPQPVPSPTPTRTPITAPAAACAYLSHYNTNTVSVIDVATRTVLGVIPVNRALSLSPASDPTSLFVSSGFALTPLDLGASTALDPQPVLAGEVGWLQPVPGTGNAVGVVGGYGSSCNFLTEFDLGAGLQTNLLGPAPRLLGINIEPQARFGYGLDYRGNRVEVVAWPSLEPLGEISTGGYKPQAITFHPTRPRAYVVGSPQVDGEPDASWADRPGAITVIDTEAQAVVGEVGTGNTPLDPAVSPDGATLYVANANSASVTVFDTESDTVRKTIPLGSAPISVAFAPDGSVAFVSGQPIAVIDTATDTAIDSIPIHEWAQDIRILEVPGGCVAPTQGPLPTPTPTFPEFTACTGDCNGNGNVTIDELMRSVSVSIGASGGWICPSMRACPGTQCNSALRAGVRNALRGCTSMNPVPTVTLS